MVKYRKNLPAPVANQIAEIPIGVIHMHDQLYDVLTCVHTSELADWIWSFGPRLQYCMDRWTVSVHIRLV